MMVISIVGSKDALRRTDADLSLFQGHLTGISGRISENELRDALRISPLDGQNTGPSEGNGQGRPRWR